MHRTNFIGGAATVAALLFAAGSVVSPAVLEACSTLSFQRRGETYYGKNYDFFFGHGMLVTNKRNVRKQGLLADEHADRAARWRSRYGSLTFNQFGRELPAGGINERGLIVELMWLVGTSKGTPGERPAVNELQWIQYQLDNFATVAEVVAHVDRIQIIPTAATLHFLVCDPGDDCAVIDFMDGRPLVYTGNRLKARTLTNTPYRESLADRIPVGLDGRERMDWADSLRRFRLLRDYLERPNDGPGRESDREAQAHPADPVAFAFAGLERVSMDLPWYMRLYFWFSGLDPATHWRIVYNADRRVVHFRSRDEPATKSVRLDAFDWSCRTPVKTLDVDTKLAGDVSENFANYRRTDNERIVVASTAWETTPRDEQEQLIDLPERFECMEEIR